MIINGEDNIEIVWNTDDLFSSKMDGYRVWSAEKMWHSFLLQV